MQVMSNPLIPEVKFLRNHEADPTQTMLGDLAAALHGIAAQNVFETLGDTSGLPPEQREALCLVAARELLSQLQTSLIMAPQSPLTPKIVETLSQAGTFTLRQIDTRFPKNKEGEQQLAGLVSTLRSRIKAGQKN